MQCLRSFCIEFDDLLDQLFSPCGIAFGDCSDNDKSLIGNLQPDEERSWTARQIRTLFFSADSEIKSFSKSRTGLVLLVRPQQVSSSNQGSDMLNRIEAFGKSDLLPDHLECVVLRAKRRGGGSFRLPKHLMRQNKKREQK